MRLTPPVRAPQGEPVPGSIAEINYLRLGGLDQWVVIRGESLANPPLLLLRGGPGFTEMRLSVTLTRRSRIPSVQSGKPCHEPGCGHVRPNWLGTCPLPGRTIALQYRLARTPRNGYSDKAGISLGVH
jgi:hypothetical protein